MQRQWTYHFVISRCPGLICFHLLDSDGEIVGAVSLGDERFELLECNICIVIPVENLFSLH